MSSAVFVDHIVVAAASLEQGAAWCEATLGVPAGPGGKHPLFGTHNRLLNVSSEAFPQCFLEIIAIDPDAPAPPRPRWFALDDAALQASLAAEGPRLHHVVARSSMLDMHRWGLINVGQPPGEPLRATRATPGGLLEWDILVPADGALLAGGALPTLLQWHGPHPTAAMPASGLQLKALDLGGVPARAREVLRLRGVKAIDAPPALRATLATPRGDVTLESR